MLDVTYPAPLVHPEDDSVTNLYHTYADYTLALACGWRRPEAVRQAKPAQEDQGKQKRRPKFRGRARRVDADDLW